MEQWQIAIFTGLGFGWAYGVILLLKLILDELRKANK
jgi:hypothetical protein